jgi:tRNA threonylcarbamoyladenosine biosynthesis protein TsaE
MSNPDHTAIPLASEEETIRHGEHLAVGLRSGDILALTGDLGAGKTHLTKGIVRGVGCGDEVSSPTFSLVHEYRGGRLPIFHFDLYRLDDPRELVGIGWEDYLEADGVCIVEWADKFPGALPRGTRWFRLSNETTGTRSIIEISPPEVAS